MKYCAILLCCFLWGAVPVLASPLGADSFFTVDIPEGWTIEAQDKGSVTMLSPDAGIMVSLVTGLNGARSRADIVEEYRKMRHVLVLLARKVDDAQAQAIVDSLVLKK